MLTHLLAGPISINGCASACTAAGLSSSSSSSVLNDTAFPWISLHLHQNRRNHQRRWGPIASSSSSIYGDRNGKNHYEVLGIRRSATSADIKKAYRLLALKYHPDVSKDSRAEDVFKSICQAYETLSNEAARIKYDQALEFRAHEGRPSRSKQNYNPDFDIAERINRWAGQRQKMKHKRYWEHNDANPYSYSETDEEAEDANTNDERGSFSEVLLTASLSLFLMQTVGSLLSLTVSCLMALSDQKLDSGYKLGYVIALILGGRGGVLLTLCLSFASWGCGKSSSSSVALVAVAMWVGSHLARYAPVPQGALLALLYMSMKMT